MLKLQQNMHAREPNKEVKKKAAMQACFHQSVSIRTIGDIVSSNHIAIAIATNESSQVKQVASHAQISQSIDKSTNAQQNNQISKSNIQQPTTQCKHAKPP